MCRDALLANEIAPNATLNVPRRIRKIPSFLPKCHLKCTATGVHFHFPGALRAPRVHFTPNTSGFMSAFGKEFPECSACEKRYEM